MGWSFGSLKLAHKMITCLVDKWEIFLSDLSEAKYGLITESQPKVRTIRICGHLAFLYCFQ